MPEVSEAELKEYLKRTDLADAKIAKLRATVEEITGLLAETSISGPSSGGGAELQAYQMEMLEKLKALKVSLEKERAPFLNLQKERDEAVAAKAKLEEQNSKMNYRIVHLMRALGNDVSTPSASGGSASKGNPGLRKGSCLQASGKWL